MKISKLVLFSLFTLNLFGQTNPESLPVNINSSCIKGEIAKDFYLKFDSYYVYSVENEITGELNNYIRIQNPYLINGVDGLFANQNIVYLSKSDANLICDSFKAITEIDIFRGLEVNNVETEKFESVNVLKNQTCTSIKEKTANIITVVTCNAHITNKDE